jgi:hypothetical protein
VGRWSLRTELCAIQQELHRECGVALHMGKNVLVHVRRDADRGKAQHLTDDLYWNATKQCQCCRGMVQVVEA